MRGEQLVSASRRNGDDSSLASLTLDGTSMLVYLKAKARAPSWNATEPPTNGELKLAAPPSQMCVRAGSRGTSAAIAAVAPIVLLWVARSGAELAIYRAFAGLSVWLAPAQMGRVFGLETGHGSAFAYAARLGGVRELTLGAGPLISHGEARRTWLRLALLCDLSDTLAAAAEARGGG